MKLYKILKYLLVDYDINLSQLSRATGVPRQTLDNWISGQEPRSLSQVKVIADYFSLSIDQLCFEQCARDTMIEYQDEINAGVFEIVLRRVKNTN